MTDEVIVEREVVVTVTVGDPQTETVEVGFQGPPGPPGPPGEDTVPLDLPDFTIIFDNQLV